MVSAMSLPVMAQTIVNGSLSDLNGATAPNPSDTTFNSLAATGWSSYSGSPDWYNPNPAGSPGNANWDLSRGVGASPGGGAFMSARVGETFGQTLSGLISGQTYTLNFFSTNAGNGTATQNTSTNYNTAGRWDVTLAGQTLSTSTRAWQGVGNQTWTAESLTFTSGVTGSSNLVFTSVATSGTQVNMGMDEISITPEPSSTLLLGLGGISLLLRRRK